MATFSKSQFFVKVVWKLFQFKKIIVSEPDLRFLPIETFSESGVLPDLLISGVGSNRCTNFAKANNLT